MNNELIECDDCGALKPEGDYCHPGHTAGGQVNGYDIDTDVCAECAQRSYESFQREMAEAAVAEMAAEEKAAGVSAGENSYRQDIAPLVIGDRWVYWLEQLQADGSRRGFPLGVPKGMRAWRADQAYIGDEQMTGIVTEHAGRTPVNVRFAIVSVTTPTREQYDAWQAARGQLVSARK